MSPSARALAVLVHTYRLAIAPYLAGQCRYVPTCSGFALDALAEHGAAKGALLALRRFLRCHPLGGHGWDPVPPRRT